jgi:hypothetical protein
MIINFQSNLQYLGLLLDKSNDILMQSFYIDNGLFCL